MSNSYTLSLAQVDYHDIDFLLPFFSNPIQAGFPSPADDFLEQDLDLHSLLIHHPSATFFIRVQGSGLEPLGVADNDIVIVDRSLTPSNHKLVVAVKDESLTLIRFHKEVHSELDIWGVVTSVIHRV